MLSISVQKIPRSNDATRTDRHHEDGPKHSYLALPHQERSIPVRVAVFCSACQLQYDIVMKVFQVQDLVDLMVWPNSPRLSHGQRDWIECRHGLRVQSNSFPNCLVICFRFDGELELEIHG